MTKKLYKISSVLLALTILSSCSKEEIIDEPVSQPQPDMENRYRLADITNQTEYTKEEFRDYFVNSALSYVSSVGTQIGIDNEDIKSILEGFVNSQYRSLSAKFFMEKHADFKFIKQNFTYRSVRSCGDSATFTGTVLYPAPKSGTHTLDGLCMFHQYVNIDKNNTPDKIYDMYNIRAMYNQALVFCCTEGFGVDYGHFAPHFDGYAKGRQCIDAAIAARQILEKRRIRFSQDSYTENIGFSLGGNAALGAQKYLESAECPDWVETEVLPDFRTFASDCPSSIKGILDYYSENDSLVFPYTVPMMVSTMFAKQPDIENKYSYLDYFDSHANDRMIWTSDWKIARELDAFFSNVYSSWNLFSFLFQYGNHMKRFLNQDLFDENGNFDTNNEKVRLLFDCLERIEISDNWVPEHQLLMTHSPEDDVIPFNTAYGTWQNFKESDANVAFVPTMGQHIIASSISYVYSCIIERPSTLINQELFNSLSLTDVILAIKDLIK